MTALWSPVNYITRNIEITIKFAFEQFLPRLDLKDATIKTNSSYQENGV